MVRISKLIIVAFLSLPVISTGAETGQPNWQLVFRYAGDDLQLLRADRIPQIAKEVRRPGLESSAVKIPYTVAWRDVSGGTLFQSVEELPLGIRITPGEDEPCRPFIPDTGVVLIRVHGPDRSRVPSSINLEKSPTVDRSASSDRDLPPAFESTSWEFALPSPISMVSPEDGPLSVTKIRDTGPDNNRLVVVVLGDGYTAANLASGDYTNHAMWFTGDIESKSPWDILFSATNIYRVDVESNEEGADNEIYGELKDTYFNSSFWTNGVERSLALNSTGYYRAFAAADAYVGVGVWDVILVLVNSTKYGGTGGTIAVSSVNSNATEIVIHELGHTFANLADEYESSIPGATPQDGEPNVDFDYSGPGLKWNVWVEPGTPLPTPELSSWSGVVGAFEGARYFETGIYRPWYACEMRYLNQEFCPVCKEAHIKEFTDGVTLLDGVTPAPGQTIEVDWDGYFFSGTPLPFAAISFQWSLDGVPIPGATAPYIDLNPGYMSGTSQMLELDVSFVSDLVRKHVISETYTWTVNAVDGECCSGIVGDANFDGSYEPTIGDITTIIDFLFITEVPPVCVSEADVNQSGGASPTLADITIGDITRLIDYLFINQTPLGACF